MEPGSSSSSQSPSNFAAMGQTTSKTKKDVIAEKLQRLVELKEAKLKMDAKKEEDKKKREDAKLAAYKERTAVLEKFLNK